MERDATLRERAAYNEQLQLTGQEWHRAQKIAEDRLQEHQLLQIKLSVIDGKLDILREDFSDKSQTLREMLANRINENGGNN